jgi:hypothetical protein
MHKSILKNVTKYTIYVLSPNHLEIINSKHCFYRIVFSPNLGEQADNLIQIKRDELRLTGFVYYEQLNYSTNAVVW